MIVADFLLEKDRSPPHIRPMWKSDIVCPECSAGYRRIVITSCDSQCSSASRSRQKSCSNEGGRQTEAALFFKFARQAAYS
jgi:hypothetical protein